MSRRWVKARDTIYCLDAGLLSASIICTDTFSWAIDGCMDSGTEKTLWAAKQACHRALEARAKEIIQVVREATLYEISESSPTDFEVGADRLKFERGREDGYGDKPPTEGTSTYLLGYTSGRQKKLDKTPADW